MISARLLYLSLCCYSSPLPLPLYLAQSLLCWYSCLFTVLNFFCVIPCFMVLLSGLRTYLLWPERPLNRLFASWSDRLLLYFINQLEYATVYLSNITGHSWFRFSYLENNYKLTNGWRDMWTETFYGHFPVHKNPLGFLQDEVWLTLQAGKNKHFKIK